MHTEINDNEINYLNADHPALIQQIHALNHQISSLQFSKDAYTAFLNHSSDFIYAKDTEHRFTAISRAFLEITGHTSAKEFIGKTDFDMFDQTHAEIYYQEKYKVINQGAVLTNIEEPYYNKDGHLCWVSTSKWPIYNAQNKITGLVGVNRDITDRKNLELQLQRAASQDELTKLSNRKFLMDSAANFFSKVNMQNKLAALYFIDLDDFKPINDAYGHEAGDAVLKSIASRLEKRFRKSDVIARIGGDEFILLLAINKKNEIEKIAKNLLNQVIKPIKFKRNTFNVGCSIGVALFPEHAQCIDKLLNFADIAMYKTKAKGKNDFHIYTQHS